MDAWLYDSMRDDETTLKRNQKFTPTVQVQMLFWGQPNRKADWMDFFLVLEIEEKSSEPLAGGRLACSSILFVLYQTEKEDMKNQKEEKAPESYLTGIGIAYQHLHVCPFVHGTPRIDLLFCPISSITAVL